jgi:hypothetical protein
MGARLRRHVLLDQEVPDRGEPFDARREGAMAGDLCVALVRPKVLRQRECDLEAVGGQHFGGTVRPFEQDHRVLRRFIDPKLGELARVAHAIEVGMHDGEARQRIGLHQREGRARHVERVIGGKMPDQRTRKRGLARPEIPGECDEVARLEHRRDVGCKPARCLLVGEHDREAGSG